MAEWTAPIRRGCGLWFAYAVLFGLISPLFFISAPASNLFAEETGQGVSVDAGGYVWTKYVFQSTRVSGRHFDDQDVYEQARFDVAVPESGRFEVHFFGTSRQDIDGGRNPRDFSPFEDIGDARKENASSRIYDAHLAIRSPVAFVSKIRVGRQSGTRDESIYFDGLSADMRFSAGFFATLYGGVVARFEELDYDWGEDALGGAGIDISPVPDSVISLDYLFVQDRRDSPGFSDRENHLYALKVWQRFARFLRAMARFRYLDGEARDVKAAAAATFPGAGFEMSAGYFRQFGEEKELSTELSNYFDIVGETSRYESYDVKLRKFFGEHYALDAGYYARRLIGDEGESSFNRDYSRAFAAFDAADLLMEGLTLSLLGEYWETDGRSYRSAGLDASYEFAALGRRAEAGAGSYYSLYKYDYYVERGERDDVRTYYAKAVLPLGKHFSADGKYEFEEGREDYHRLSFGARYDF